MITNGDIVIQNMWNSIRDHEPFVSHTTHTRATTTTTSNPLLAIRHVTHTHRTCNLYTCNLPPSTCITTTSLYFSNRQRQHSTQPCPPSWCPSILFNCRSGIPSSINPTGGQHCKFDTPTFSLSVIAATCLCIISPNHSGQRLQSFSPNQVTFTLPSFSFFTFGNLTAIFILLLFSPHSSPTLFR